MLTYGELLDLNCFLKFILMMIVPILVFLVWEENQMPNSNEASHYSNGEELAETCDEIDQLFEQGVEQARAGVVRACCACSFCGKVSDITTRCSRCKVALYCSKVCHVMHWRYWHKYECVETEAAEDQEGSLSHGTHFFLMESQNKTDVEEVPYIHAGESSDGTSKSWVANVIGYDGCAVCGNPSTKICARCKSIKYCSQTCQHSDWRSGHKFHCVGEKANCSTRAATTIQERPAHGNVPMPTNSYAVEDHVNSPDHLSLEFHSEGNADAKALILCSQEASNECHKEIEEHVRSLKEELEKIKNKNISLQLERDNWEKQARYAVDRLHSFWKENEHQLFVLKHENEMISNAEKEARKMLHSLSERLHCLKIEMENGVVERKKQEEHIHRLLNECAKVKTELQEQKKCVQRLIVDLDEAAPFPMRIAKVTRQRLANSLCGVSVAESKAPAAVETISLSRNPSYTRQVCAVCLSNEKDMALGCGHMTCRDCGTKIHKCHICRKQITNRIRLFPG